MRVFPKSEFAIRNPKFPQTFCPTLSAASLILSSTEGGYRDKFNDLGSSFCRRFSSASFSMLETKASASPVVSKAVEVCRSLESSEKEFTAGQYQTRTERLLQREQRRLAISEASLNKMSGEWRDDGMHDIKRREREHRLQGDRLPDVVLDVMTQLMCHDDFDFFRGKILEKRIRDNDAPRVSPSHYGRIGFARFVSEGHSKIPHYACTRRGGQRLTDGEILVFYRFEFEEQRSSNIGARVRHNDSECNEGDAGVESTIDPGRREADSRPTHRGHAQRHTDGDPLEMVFNPLDRV